jgi:hypothetical protein
MELSNPLFKFSRVPIVRIIPSFTLFSDDLSFVCGSSKHFEDEKCLFIELLMFALAMVFLMPQSPFWPPRDLTFSTAWVASSINNEA